MHPAGSVILFTSLTGFGYGFLYWLSFVILSNNLLDKSSIIITATIGFLLIVSGLMCSLWHLGHPERAWRAMSQWRTSWLSREGLLASLSFLPIFGLMFSAYFDLKQLLVLFTILTVVLSFSVIYSQSMIYASLKPIPAWHNIWTVLGYFIYALSSGGVLWWFLSLIFIGEFQDYYLLILFLVLGVLNKILWLNNLNKKSQTTIQTATGLKGKVTQLDPPHSSENYLMKEMGFVLARKYSIVLQFVTFVFGFILPIVLVLLNNNSILISGLSLLFCIIGILSQRYLFFAKAKHCVTLYYGR